MLAARFEAETMWPQNGQWSPMWYEGEKFTSELEPPVNNISVQQKSLPESLV